jgi:DNA polymerase-3 subunit epsilon
MLRHITLSRPLAVFDLETTGPHSDRDRIIEISILRLAVDGTSNHLTQRVNPEMPIGPGATEIHGITDADVAGEPTFRQVVREVLTWLDGCDLCGYNLRRFDLRMLINECKRIGVRFDPTTRKVIDPMVIFHQRERRDLVAAVKRYCDRDHLEAHGARADVLATLDVLNAQLEHYADLPRTIDELHDACSDPAAVDFEGKFKRIDGKVVITIGKYAGRAVEELVTIPDGRGFLQWMLGKDFLDDTKAVARFYLND